VYAAQSCKYRLTAHRWSECERHALSGWRWVTGSIEPPLRRDEHGNVTTDHYRIPAVVAAGESLGATAEVRERCLQSAMRDSSGGSSRWLAIAAGVAAGRKPSRDPAHGVSSSARG